MDKHFCLKFLVGLTLLLNSCAQLGEISGGEQDRSAPKPIENGVQPVSGTTNFNSKTIHFKFDEYFKLNNPLENITILPKGPEITTEVHKKELIVNLKGELQANTTYQITFNSAIRDLNEGNDSLMTYVFSTGSFIDSLKYESLVKNAYSSEAQENVLVALYASQDSLKNISPLYYTKTDKTGHFEFNYLKAGTYYLYAFKDDNKDLKFQNSELVGFQNDRIKLDSSYIDTNAILLFPNVKVNKINSKSYTFPSQITLAGNCDFRSTDIFYKETKIPQEKIHFYKTDSITFLLPDSLTNDFTLTVKNDFYTDTLSFRFPINTGSPRCEIQPNSGVLGEEKEVSFYFSDNIIAFESSMIHLVVNDSLKPKSEIIFENNLLRIILPEEKGNKIKIDIPPSALAFENSSLIDSISVSLKILSENEFGMITFPQVVFPENTYLELLSGTKALRKIKCSELVVKKQLNFIAPGEYSFRVILDKNDNFKWDGGNVDGLKQGEKVFNFPKKIKVRSGWETEVELDFSK